MYPELRKISRVLMLGERKNHTLIPTSFDVSPDEKTIVFSQFDQSGSDLRMIDQFRMQ